MMSARRFLTVREAARVLRVRPAQCYALIRQGVVPSERVMGRIAVPAEAAERLAADGWFGRGRGPASASQSGRKTAHRARVSATRNRVAPER